MTNTPLQFFLSTQNKAASHTKVNERDCSFLRHQKDKNYPVFFKEKKVLEEKTNTRKGFV